MPPALAAFTCLACGKANAAERRQCTQCKLPRPFAAGAAAAARGPSPRRGVGRGPALAQPVAGQQRSGSQRPAPWVCSSCSFADNFAQRKDCYQCGKKKAAGAATGERQRGRRGRSGRDSSPAPPSDFGELVKREAARLQGLAGPTTAPALAGAAASAAPTTAPALAAATAPADDTVATARARLKDIAATLQQIGGCSDPQVGAARARLEQEMQELALQLHSTLPLRAQLRSAMAHLKAGLTACAATAASIQELELVLEDRRRTLEELRNSTVSHQQQVDTLTKEIREEEAQRLAAVASQCQASVGAALAPQPTLATAPQMTLEELAAAFHARSPPSVASSFKQWLDVQAPLSAVVAPTAAPAAPTPSAGPPAAPSLTAQLVGRRQQRAGTTRAMPSSAPLALPAPAPAPLPAQPGEPGATPPPTAIEVDLEENEEQVDWSGAGLAQPVGFAPAAAPRGPSVLAFGKVIPASRSARGAPYASSSELADAAASVQAAEQLLASSPESLATSELPGGVAVKTEDASA